MVAVPAVTAQSNDPTPVPASYYGTVTIDGEPTADLTVTAELNGTEYGSITTGENGDYGGPTAADQRLVVDPPEIPNNTEVTFFVEDSNGDRTAVTRTEPETVTWEADDNKRVDLALSTAAPSLQVRNLTQTRRVAQGDNTTISATVENIGGTGDTQEIELAVAGETAATTSRTLLGGERTRISFSNVSTSDLTRGDVAYTVSSADDTDSGELIVEDADFEIENIETNSPVVAGDDLSLTATVSNVGEIAGNVTANLSILGESNADSETKQNIAAGESTEITLKYTTTTEDIGASGATVSAGDVTETQAVVVQRPAEFNITKIDTASAVTVGDAIDVTTTIRNDGDVTGSTPVNFSVGASENDNSSISLNPGDSTKVEFSYTTDQSDVPTTDLNISTDDDSRRRTLQVAADASVNTSASSVDFTDDAETEIIGGNATNYTIDAVIDSDSLDELPDKTGTATIELRSFTDLSRADGDITGISGDSFTIEYNTTDDFESGTVNISTEVNATAPVVGSSLPVRVTALRQNGTSFVEDPVEIGTIDVTDPDDRPIINITANTSSIFRDDTVRFTTTNASNGSAISGATVTVGDNEGTTGSNGNVTLEIGTVGDLAATATPPSDSFQTNASSSTQIDVSPPELTVSPETHAFSDVATGNTSTTNITVNNPTQSSIDVSTPSIEGSAAFSSNASEFPDEIQSGATETVKVEFAPSANGTDTAELAIRDQTVELTGTGVEPAINVTSTRPVSITADNGTDVAATVTISNDGTDSLNASLSVADSNFSVGTTEINISAGSSDSFDVTFNAPEDPETAEIQSVLTVSPKNTAVENATLDVIGTVIQRKTTIGSDTVEVGTGGNVTVNETGRSIVTVENDGTTTEDLTATVDDDQFGVAPEDQQFTLAPGDTEVVTINATPNTGGLTQATLTVENTSDSINVSDTATVNVTGQAPGLTVATDSIDFGEVSINSIATNATAITNDGNATLRILNTSAGGPFTAPAPPATVVAAGETATIPVQFNPESSYQGGVSDTLSLNTTARNETIQLSGSTIPSSVSFDSGSREQGFGTVGLSDTATETLSLTNTGGPFDVDEVRINGDDAFTPIERPDRIVNSETLTVRFEPTTAGTNTTTVTLVEGDTGSGTVSASLTGTGRQAEFAQSQQRLRTGVAEQGGATTGSIGISNPAIESTQLDITGLSLDDTENFSIVTNEQFIINGGKREDILVEFTPDEDALDGTVETNLSVDYSTGAKSETVTIPVTGTVSAPEPVVSTTDVSVGELPFDETRSQVISVGNDGGEPFTLDDINPGDDVGVTTEQIGLDKIVPGSETLIVATVDPDSRTDVTNDIDTNITITAEEDIDDQIPGVNVNATVVTPELNVTTGDSVEFGETDIGSATRKTVEIENTGNTTLDIAPPTLEDNSQFSILSGSQRLSIPAGGSETVAVAFEPTEENSISTSLTLTPTNDPDVSTKTVSLQGNGKEADSNATLTRSAPNLGDVRLGETNSTTIDLRNDGEEGSTLVTTGASVIGADSNRFDVQLTEGRSLAAGQTESIDVTVNTTNADRGSLSSLIQIQTGDGSVTAAVAATAVAPNPAVEIPTGADFETTRLGATSTAEVVLRNDGNAELNVSDVTITGADVAAFELDGTPTGSLQPQETQRLDVTFDPGALADANQRAQNSPLSADASIGLQTERASVANPSTKLSATAETAVVETPRTLTFGDTPIGETRTRNLTITNNNTATAPVKIEALRISGRDASTYSATRTGDAILADGESTTVRVDLTPDDLDRQFGTLTVETNSTRQPVRKVGLSNDETTYRVNYGSVNVTYENPVNGQEPTADVDAGFESRNATLTSVSANVSAETGTPDDYTLAYEYGTSPSDAAGATPVPELGLNTTESNETNTTDIADVQYISAETAGAAEIDTDNSNKSTFRIEVSKATIAEQNATNESVVINETNVNIYHENETGTGYEQPAEQGLLFETTQGYVYEVTTDSYSVFAVGVAEPEATTETEDPPDPPGNPDDDGGQGGGSAEMEQQEDQEQQEAPTVEDAREEVEAIEPATETSVSIEEAGTESEDGSGITVDVSEQTETEAVDQITFEDAEISGTVDVEEYTDPPEDVTETVAESVAQDVAGDEATSDESTADSESANVNVVTIADISISSDDADTSDTSESDSGSADTTADSGTTATVTMSVSADELDNPANAVIVHEREDGWEELETSVVDTTSGEVTLEAQTESFSLFAVTEVQEPAQTETTEQTEETTENKDEDGSPVVPIIVGLLAVAAVGGAVYYLRGDES